MRCGIAVRDFVQLTSVFQGDMHGLLIVRDTFEHRTSMKTECVNVVSHDASHCVPTNNFRVDSQTPLF